MLGRLLSTVVGLLSILALAACAGREPLKDPAAMAHRAAVEAGREHLVLPGETLSEVAERYGLGLSRLAQANGIQPPYQAFAGQIIILPRPDPAARPVRTETVRRGDTLAAIAARHKLRLGDIVAANPDLDPDRIRPGQTVRLPGDIAMPPAPAMSAEEVETVRRASLMKPPSLSGDGFIWPVLGRVVSRFGDKPDGTRNAGINLAAPLGTPVLAAENGIVVYAGDRLPGYGEMLLIRHAGGFTTAYAHNQTLLARVGDRVLRGQKIATVGTSGGMKEPQLHFEIRTGSTPIDPLQHLESEPDRTQVASTR
jgi:murein DD-endopeptidase MepM/ murein hydrolase activator NlpD